MCPIIFCATYLKYCKVTKAHETNKYMPQSIGRKIKNRIVDKLYEVAAKLEPSFDIPAKMKYDLAIEAIDEQSDKGQATFMYRYVNTRTDRHLTLMEDYIRLARKSRKKTN